MRFNKYLVSLLALFHIGLPLKAENIILDFGGVVIDTSRKSTTWQVGPLKFMRYILAGNGTRGMSNTLRNRLFAFFNLIEPRHSDEVLACDEQGNLLPQCMCDLLAGRRSMEETRYIINDALEKHSAFFKNKSEKKLISAITRMMFNPKTFAKTRKLIPDTLAFIKDCKKDGHNIYGLSNWDKESGKLVIKEFKLDKYFDGIVLSGDVGYIKPDPAIYVKLLQEHNLDPEECIFFDDCPENIETARALGMHAVLYDKTCTADDMYLALYEWEQSKAAYNDFAADYGIGRS